LLVVFFEFNRLILRCFVVSSGGLFGDFFTVAVRTGGEGLGGISLLLLEKSMPGITIRKMETQFDNAHSTTFITFDNVRVPVTHLIGEENQGALPLLVNFNHERWIIAAGASRAARVCYEESLMYAMKRKTFGKTLVSHQLIRYKFVD
jgi:alkylation response protein AidB-like acyl-CoA dehydrogenase